MIRSSCFGEADDITIFSEAFSAKKQIVLSDESHLTSTISAFSAIFTEFSSMSSPQQVWHFFLWQNLIFLQLIQIYLYNLHYLKTYTIIFLILCSQLIKSLKISNFIILFQTQDQNNKLFNLAKSILKMNHVGRTFSVDDMETYFKNYVPCNFHKKQPITNFCIDPSCNKYLCPECVQQHSKVYSNHIVQSIKTCITRTKYRLDQTIQTLESQTRKNNFLSPQNHEQFTKKLIIQMQQVKKSLIHQIQQYFKQKEAQIRRQTSKYTNTQNNLQNLKKQLQQAMKELKFLKKNLFQTSKTVQVIQRANRIDYQVMIDHFRKKIKKVEKDLKINIKLQTDSKRRDQFIMSLNQMVGIRGKDDKSMKRKQQFHDSLMNSPSNQNNKKIDQYFASTKKEFVVNPQPLSADRYFTKTSFLIEQQNYFKSGEPFLHFFQVSKSNLHVVKIRDLQENSEVKWQIIALNINFKIPSFHRTIATEQGVIYLIGGTDETTMKKNPTIYQYAPGTRGLKAVSKLNFSRSSHSLTCFKGLIYIIGGMGDNDVLKQCQIFNPSLKTAHAIASCKYATVNSCVCWIAKDNLLKIGGIFANGQNNDHIQIYNVTANLWAEVDPVIQNIKGDFALLSCSGWAPLSPLQVFIFGGYNEEKDNQSSNNSFVIEYDYQQNEYSIKYINVKNPPLEEGFWSPQSIVYNNTIYALQNIDGDEGGQCIEDKRNVLIFDGKYWKICTSA